MLYTVGVLVLVLCDEVLVSRDFQDLPLCFSSVLESEKAVLKTLDLLSQIVIECVTLTYHMDPDCACPAMTSLPARLPQRTTLPTVPQHPPLHLTSAAPARLPAAPALGQN